MVSMIVTLTGPNSLLLKQELKKMTNAFVEEHGDIALENIEGDEASVERVKEALTSVPFLASKKMVVLKVPSTNKQFLEASEGLIMGLPETTDLVIVEPKLDKRLQYYKLLKKVTDFKEFTDLDINGLVNWSVEEAKAKGGSLSSSNARYLVERVGQSQQLLSNEIDKLVIYDPEVTKQTIDLLTDAAPQSTIFELIDSAFSGNTRKTMRLYEEQRSQKVEPQNIIAMLAWQLNVVAIIKAAGDRSTDEIAREAKVNPFVVRKSSSIARRLTLAELKEHISSLAELDIKSKRVSIDIDEALQHYLLKLSASSN